MENVNVFWSLFAGEFQEEWKNDSDFSQYIAELISYPIEKLRGEPDALKEEKRFVLHSTQKLAFNNYKTFIETAECTREVFKEFVAVEDHVERLLEKIPGVSEACKKFSKEAEEVNRKRKLNSLALSRHTQMLEVLEIPQVMETCVRNGYYEEALDLSAHVRRMNKKHGDIPIIKDIDADVESALDLMLQQLLQQLRGPIQLPSCLRVVGFLRRMEVFSDTELRLKFLQARDNWLQSVLAAIPKEDPYSHITKTIELSRVHLFDIVTQYRAIFPDEDSASSLAATSSGRHGNRSAASLQGVLFYTWVNEKIWEFLHVLERDLSCGVSTRIDSVLSQTMYFGLSFGRVGADFRSLVVPVFVRVLLNNFRLALRSGKHEFHESMKRLSLIHPLHHSSSTSSTHHPSSLSSLAPPPPHSLLDFPPLAALTNAIIEAFNALRQCAPLAGGPEVSQELRRLLESTVHDIVEYHKIERDTFTAKNLECYRQMVRVVVTDFLPFVKTVFDNLYSCERVSQLALTSSSFALRHHTTPPGSAGSNLLPSLRGSAAGFLSLKMELDLMEIASPLKAVTPGVFQELEAAAEEKHLKQDVTVVEPVKSLEELGSQKAEKDVDTVEAATESDSVMVEVAPIAGVKNQESLEITDSANVANSNSTGQNTLTE